MDDEREARCEKRVWPKGNPRATRTKLESTRPDSRALKPAQRCADKRSSSADREHRAVKYPGLVVYGHGHREVEAISAPVKALFYPPARKHPPMRAFLAT